MNKNEKIFVGPKLFPWQEKIHNTLLKHGKGSGSIVVVKSKRQIGKTMSIICELLYFAIEYPKTINCLLSPTLNQARKVYKEIINATIESGIIKKKNDSLLEITFINGSEIIFKSSEQKDSLRGFTITGLLCIDEAAFSLNDEIWGIISPTTDVYNAPTLMVSTPKFRTGVFYRYFNYGILKKHPNIIAIDINDFDTTALLSKEQLEQYRETLPKNQFVTEYLGEFLDSDAGVFENFSKCIFPKGEIEKENYNSLYLGIDWSTGVGKDYTAIVGFDENGNERILDYFNKLNFSNTIDRISSILENNKEKIKAVISENNSIGSPQNEKLIERFPNLNIIRLTQTNQSKIELVNNLQQVFEKEQIKLFTNKDQYTQLSFYEAKYNEKTGNISYNAAQGANDDIVLAMMMAWKARKDNLKKGNYVFGFA